ncbi:hypothetical protein [Solimonas flava]|uniref:hypothetical protein n=1 Tax=Solimonas flava TaxID=415849 RepID=UPI0003F7177B|nr:hypothetical protein [Solimonas flava]
MNARWLWAAVSVVLLGVLALVLLRPEPMLSPGPLQAAHADLTGDCFACHQPFRGSSAERCIACHQVDRIGRYTTSGAPIAAAGAEPKVPFHQHLLAQNCMACHAEHQGRAMQHPEAHFSHTLLEPGIRGDCLACHRKPQDSLHATIAGDCQQCHSQEHWRPAQFEHARFFLLEGVHRTSCATCHTGQDFTQYTCFGCHEHSPARVRAEHAEEGITDIDNCAECHRSAEDEHHGRRDE